VTLYIYICLPTKYICLRREFSHITRIFPKNVNKQIYIFINNKYTYTFNLLVIFFNGMFALPNLQPRNHMVEVICTLHKLAVSSHQRQGNHPRPIQFRQRNLRQNTHLTTPRRLQSRRRQRR